MSLIFITIFNTTLKNYAFLASSLLFGINYTFRISKFTIHKGMDNSLLLKEQQ